MNKLNTKKLYDIIEQAYDTSVILDSYIQSNASDLEEIRCMRTVMWLIRNKLDIAYDMLIQHNNQ